MPFILKRRPGCKTKFKGSLFEPFTLFFTIFFLLFIQTGTRAGEALLGHEKAWTGDFDGMVERRKIRVLVPYSKTFYFLDGATQQGISYQGMQIFEKWLNKEFGTGHLKVNIIRPID